MPPHENVELAKVDEQPRVDCDEFLEKQTSNFLEKTTIDMRLAEYSAEERKKVMWRVDRRLIPILGLLYFVSLIDRTNTGLALVVGMRTDLKLIGYTYNTIVLMFFVTCGLVQPISTIIMRRTGPRIFLASIAFLWGLTTISMGFVRVWTDMIPLRLLLGVFESGLFPGCIYLLSCWYTRYDLQKRYAAWYMIGSVTSSLSGIISYAFSQMDGLGSGPSWWGAHLANGKFGPGIAGWRWIFILEGTLTCALALGSCVLIVDFPELATKRKPLSFKFLEEKEADFIIATIEHDRQDVQLEMFSVGQFLRHALDLKVLGFATIYALNTCCAYAISYFLPIILNSGMGFNVSASQCLTTPPYFVAAGSMYLTAYLSDKYRIRSPFIIFHALLCLLGLALLGYAKNVGVRYFGAFLAITGCNTNITCILTWQANNIRGQWKRALCSTTLVLAGNVGGVIGTTVFRNQDKPNYGPGMLTTMIACGLIVLLSLLMVFKFHKANQRAIMGGKLIGGLEGFRYTL